MELAGGITQDDVNLFLQEADEQLQLLDEDIVRLEKKSGDPELMQEIFRAAHTLKGSSAMVGHQRLSELAHAMENVLDNVRKGPLAVTPMVVDALLHGLDVMRALRDEMVDRDAMPVDIKDVVDELTATINKDKQQGGQGSGPEIAISLNDEAKARLEKALQAGKQGFRIRVMLDQESGWASVRCYQIIQELSPIGDIIATQPSQEEIEKGNAGEIFYLIVMSFKDGNEISRALSSIGDITGIEINEFKERWSEAVAASPDGGDAAASKKDESKLTQTVRVNVGRLDTLMEQVGELVINRNRISQIGKLLSEKYREDDDVNTLSDSVAQIAKIVTNLQQDVMSIRLLPIEIVFNTLPRLVRDLARKENKKIDFIIEGQETEVDRSIIEHLRDPLVHLLRNAVDHGIESPKERLEAGKPEVGTVLLTAYHEQDTIIIKLKDDGCGIDPEKVRRAAVNKKIATEEEVAKLDDEEAINLIFSSGFSTAKKITDISGRGVGLDVVKTNIEVLNGIIHVESVPGKGTTFTLTLPLTLAIIPALLVAIRQTICAVPLSNIVEITRFEAQDLRTVRGREVAMLRGDVLPILRMNEVFGWYDEEKKDISGKYVVVVKYSGARVGLTVDVLLEQQELVVKSLDQIIGGSNSFSGASILGDGTVVLILDVASLIRGVVAERQNSGLAAISSREAEEAQEDGNA